MRSTDATHRFDWPGLLIEGALIVASILLAFAVDASWDGYREGVEEQTALRGLAEDFAANVAQLAQVAQVHQRADDRMIALETTTATDLMAVPADSLVAYLFAGINDFTFDARDGTLDALIGAGRLGLIRDAALRDALVAWKAKVDDLAEESAEFRVAGHFVADRIGDLGGPWSAPGPTAFFPQPGLDASWRRLSPIDLVAASRDAELRKLVCSTRFWALVYLSQLIPLQEQASKTLARVQEELRQRS